MRMPLPCCSSRFSNCSHCKLHVCCPAAVAGSQTAWLRWQVLKLHVAHAATLLHQQVLKLQSLKLHVCCPAAVVGYQTACMQTLLPCHYKTALSRLQVYRPTAGNFCRRAGVQITRLPAYGRIILPLPCMHTHAAVAGSQTACMRTPLPCCMYFVS
jgi:hypothetical protein